MFTDFFNNSVTSPVKLANFCNRAGDNIELTIKRDDLIDRAISGNKWRKLKHNFIQLSQSNYRGIASFGGAFSNHIAALAAAGARAKVATIGFIRSHEIDLNNPTLALASNLGMALIPLDRNTYKKRHDPEFIAYLQQQYPDYMFVPEGGSNEHAALGLKELAQELSQQSSCQTIACAIGSGGTISGLLSHMPEHQFIGVAAVNDTALLTRLSEQFGSRLTVVTSALFGGYGKTNDTLNQFCFDFAKQTQVPIEPIYTGKLFYALCEQDIAKQQPVLAIHTGGLQGLKGLDYRRQCPPHLWQQAKSLLDA